MGGGLAKVSQRGEDRHWLRGKALGGVQVGGATGSCQLKGVTGWFFSCVSLAQWAKFTSPAAVTGLLGPAASRCKLHPVCFVEHVPLTTVQASLVPAVLQLGFALSPSSAYTLCLPSTLWPVRVLLCPGTIGLAWARLGLLGLSIARGLNRAGQYLF